MSRFFYTPSAFSSHTLIQAFCLLFPHSLCYTDWHTHAQTHTYTPSHTASQPFAPHSHPQILPSSALPAQRQTGAARQPVKGVEGRSSRVRERDTEREREGDERVKGEQSRESAVPHMLKRHGRLNKLPPLKPPDSWDRQTPIPQRAWNCSRTTREREGSQRGGKKVQREERRGKKATTVGCPTQLLCRDDVTGHVTQALQWRHMEGRKETSFKAGAFWVVWGLCSPPKQPQNHRRAARGWCLRATWSVNG